MKAFSTTMILLLIIPYFNFFINRKGNDFLISLKYSHGVECELRDTEILNTHKIINLIQ